MSNKSKASKFGSTYKMTPMKAIKYAASWDVVHMGVKTLYSLDYHNYYWLSTLPSTILFGVGSFIGGKIASNKEKNPLVGALIGGVLLSVPGSFAVTPIENHFKKDAKNQRASGSISAFDQTAEELAATKPNTINFAQALVYNR